jgi:hypothetical protein
LLFIEGVASYANAWVFQSSPQTLWYWHTGKTSGMHSIVAVWPEGELGLAVLTNVRANKIPEKLTQRLMELYFCGGFSAGLQDGGCSSQPHQGISGGAAGTSAAAIPPGKLVGTYVNPVYGKVVITKEGNGVSMSLGPAKHRSMLTPSDVSAYCFTWPDQPSDCTTVKFKTDRAGEVTKLTIEGFEDVRGGEFKKVNP